MGYHSEIYHPGKEYDFIVTGKEFSPEHLIEIREWKKKGISVICDINEDILEFPLVIETLKECDQIVCCSEKLEQRIHLEVLDWGDPDKVTVIEDAVEPS